MSDDDERLIDLLELLEDSAQEAALPLSREAIESDPALSAAVAAWGGELAELEQHWSKLRSADEQLAQFIEPADLPLPEIEGYEAVAELGHGGMGIVYRATQTSLGREVALKLIGSGRLASQRMRQRFLAETQALARLRDPSIVQVYDAGQSGGELYLAMELLDGGTLADRLAGRTLPPREAAELIERLARAVAHAHEQGILHRDLKPANVLFDRDGAAKLADFGLAKLLDGESGATATGEMPGTPSYMAPEQISGKDVGEPTDVYGLGAVLYEALVGRPPFLGETSAETLVQVPTRAPVPPRRLRKEVPRDLEAVCLKCLEKDPRRRYGSAAALAADLRRWLAGESTVARPLTWRGVLWRRAAARPVTSALILLAVISVISVAVGASVLAAYLNRSLQAVRQREADLKARLYAWDTKQGLDAWPVYSRQQNLEMLNRYVPGEAEEDLRSFTWHYWNRMCRGAEREIVGHAKQVYGLVYSADGRYLVSGGADGRICVWEVATGRPSDEQVVDHGEVSNVAFSPDGKTLLCGCQDGTIVAWQWAEGKFVSTAREYDTGERLEVRGVAMSPDGGRIAAAIPGGEMVMLNTSDGTQLPLPAPVPTGCKAVGISPDGRWLISVGGPSIRRLDLHANVWLDDVAVEHGVDSIAFSPEGNWLAAVGQVGMVARFEMSTGQSESLYHHGSQAVYEADVSPDGRYLLSAGEDEMIRIWDVAAQRQAAQVKAHSGVVWTARFSPDGQTMASCGSDRVIRIWSTASLLGPSRVLASEKLATCLSFSPDSKSLIVGGHEDGSATVWDVNTWEIQRELPLGTSTVPVICALADDRLFFIDNLSPGIVELAVYDKAGGRSLLPLRVPTNPYQLHASHDHGVVAIVLHGAPDWPGRCLVYDFREKRVQFEWTFEEPPRYVSLAPDGSKAINVGISGKTEIISAEGVTELSSIVAPPPGHGWGGFTWTADLQAIAYVEEESTIVLRQVATGERLGQLVGHSDRIVLVICSPDNRVLASCDVQGTIHLWDRLTLEHAGTLKVPGQVGQLVFSPDSRMLAGIGQAPGEQNTRAYVWDARERGASEE